MSRHRIRHTLLALCVAVAACGRKSLPIAPELVHPKPPADVIASATPGGVLLRWARPSQYTSGQRMRDLDGFVVERAQDVDGKIAFAEVSTIHLEDRYRFQQQRRVEWTDADVNDGQRYFYRVSALTLDGYRSEPAGPVSIDYNRADAKPVPARSTADKKRMTMKPGVAPITSTPVTH